MPCRLIGLIHFTAECAEDAERAKFNALIKKPGSEEAMKERDKRLAVGLVPPHFNSVHDDSEKKKQSDHFTLRPVRSMR